MYGMIPVRDERWEMYNAVDVHKRTLHKQSLSNIGFQNHGHSYGVGPLPLLL
jgi:hypothetical protein